MSQMIRFVGTVTFNSMQREYEKRYEGHEHDIRFDREQRLLMEVRVALPHMLTLGDVESDIAYAVKQATNKLSRELADIYERSIHEKAKGN
jgi:hypothetical protein